MLVSVLCLKGYASVFVEFAHGYTLTMSELAKCFQDFFVTGFFDGILFYSESFSLSCHYDGLINCFINMLRLCRAKHCITTVHS